MLYHIGYCPAKDECFSMTQIDPSDIYLLEYFAVYDSFNDTLEYDFKYFNWGECRGDWDQEAERIVKEIKESSAVWYCLVHGDCHITDIFTTPTDPCFTSPSHTRDPNNWRSFCICEQIATCHGDQIVSNVGDLRKYFDDAADGYTLQSLEQTLTFHNVSTLCI